MEAAQIVEHLNKFAVFRIEPFDTRAAMELAAISREGHVDADIPAPKEPEEETRGPPKTNRAPDDFLSVARRLGADESKERFEAKLI